MYCRHLDLIQRIRSLMWEAALEVASILEVTSPSVVQMNAEDLDWI